jgi:ABC-type branched-subunit amino acid transport system ATPase component/ABC-type branched-subunit amino acid transport system permease subunit
VDRIAASRPRSARRRFFQVIGLALVSLALICAGPFLLDSYTVNILVRSFLYAATALTVDVLWGYTGILTFGQSAFFGIGAYAAALTFTHFGFSTEMAVFALVAGIVASATVAAIIGWISFWHGASSLYVAIVTLALAIIVVQLLYAGGSFTGSSSGLVGYETFDISVEAWFWIAGSALVAVTVGGWFLVNSDFGRVLVALRENESRCTYLGISAPRLKIFLMMAAAAIAALAGYGYASYTVVVAPEIASFVFGTELVIWVALGGRGTLLGPVLAAIAIDFISAYLSGNLPYVWKLIVGVIFVAVIVALPQGFLPSASLIWHRLSRRLRQAPDMAKGAVVTITPAGPPSLVGEGPAAPAVAVESLDKRYGSSIILNGVSFIASGSEILSIVGPNGAGKTTLMRCLSSGTERSAGTVAFYGANIGRLPPYRVTALGVGRSFQATSLFETLTVAECLMLARFRIRRPSLFRRDERLVLPSAAMRVVTATALDQQLATEVRHLSHGQKRALELAMVLALEPNVLLLDEPTAGLTKQERTLIGAILIELTRREAMCVVIIEHDLDFVREISSRILVLHQGKVLLDGSVKEVVESEVVRNIYAGQVTPDIEKARS